MTLKIIAAVAANGVIGRGGDIPWNLPDDFKMFREATLGKTVVQGHKTLCSIIKKLHKPLPGRRNIVLTRHTGTIKIDGVEVFTDFDQVIELAKTEEVFVIGGAELYKLALPHAEELFLTRVHEVVTGDVSFPDWDKSEWSRTSRQKHEADEKDQTSFTWEVYRRRTARYIEMANCRTDKQRAEMQAILEDGNCPFCQANLKKWHDNPILWNGLHWVASKNDYPYPGTQTHLILILKDHAETLAEILPGAFEELGSVLQWAEREFDVSGGGFYMRFGEPLWTGGTIRHIHAHLAERETARSESVKFYL